MSRFVATVEDPPDVVTARMEDALSKLASRVTVRVVSSAGGTNVYIDTRPQWSRWLVLAILAGLLTLAILGIVSVVSYRERCRRHDARLRTPEFATGASRADVIARLGQPDVELSTSELARFATGLHPDCVRNASRELYYVGSRLDKAVYCAIYLDSRDRVLCVEHSLTPSPRSPGSR